MVTNYTIDENGFFSGNGLIPFLLRESEDPITVQIVFNEILRDVKKLHDVYILTMSDDKKIIGRERFQICKELDNLLGDMVLLRLMLSGSKNSFDISFGNHSEHIQFKILKDRWSGEGNFGEFRKLNFDKFQYWLTKFFSQRLNHLIQFLQPKLNKLKLHEEEKIQSYSYLDKLIVSVIISRNDIYTARLS